MQKRAKEVNYSFFSRGTSVLTLADVGVLTLMTAVLSLSFKLCNLFLKIPSAAVSFTSMSFESPRSHRKRFSNIKLILWVLDRSTDVIFPRAVYSESVLQILKDIFISVKSYIYISSNARRGRYYEQCNRVQDRLNYLYCSYYIQWRREPVRTYLKTIEKRSINVSNRARRTAEFALYFSSHIPL